jgi:hypothetical protein
MLRITPTLLLLGTFWLTGCAANNDATPTARSASGPGASGAPGVGVRPHAAGKFLDSKMAPNRPDAGAARGDFILPSKYMLMTPPPWINLPGRNQAHMPAPVVLPPTPAVRDNLHPPGLE